MMRDSNVRWIMWLVLACGLFDGGCGALDEPLCEDYDCSCPEYKNCALAGTALRFDVRSDAMPFFSAPWPADARLLPDGHPDLRDFPNPSNSSMLIDYRDTIMAETTGWGTNQAIYFSFDGPIDPQSLPSSPEATVASGSPVFLVDISQGPGRGERIPLSVRYLEHERQFTPSFTLVLRPVLGFVLRQNTLYAAVVTRDVLAADGKALGSPDDFERTKYTREPENKSLKAWWETMQLAWPELEAIAGIDASQLAAATVFTTQDIHSEMDRLAGTIANMPVPGLESWGVLSEMAHIYRVEAWFELPEFQAGEPPDFKGGGGIVFDEEGRPVVQRKELVAFTLAIPKGDMPTDGWPLVIYAHGTGGSRNGFSNGDDSVADLLARRSIASIGMDQPLQGDRNPWGRNEDIITFNPYNILAMRDNFRQAAVDMMVLRRIISQLKVPARFSPTGQDVIFDDSKVAFMGHSQGSLNGPIYLAHSPDVLGAVFSGAGGGLVAALLGKTEPVDIPGLIILGMGLEPDEFDMDHPVLAMFQMFAERADPINYARRLISYSPAGGIAKHLFFSQGLKDQYALPIQTQAMAAASGCFPAAPIQGKWPAFDLMGREPLDLPISGNTMGPGGRKVTAVMVQYPDYGHFAVFDSPDAKTQYLGFLESMLKSDIPIVPSSN